MYPLFLLYFNNTKFSRQIFEKLKNLISRKFFQWKPSCSTRTHRRTDMTKLIVVFRNLAKALKKLCTDNIVHSLFRMNLTINRD